MARVTVHNAREIKQMEKACRLAADLLVEAGKIIRPGLRTSEIDEFVAIPMAEGVESLNLSVAAGVLMYQLTFRKS